MTQPVHGQGRPIIARGPVDVRGQQQAYVYKAGRLAAVGRDPVGNVQVVPQRPSADRAGQMITVDRPFEEISFTHVLAEQGFDPDDPAGRGRAPPSRAPPSRAPPSRAPPSRALPSRAEQR